MRRTKGRRNINKMKIKKTYTLSLRSPAVHNGHNQARYTLWSMLYKNHFIIHCLLCVPFLLNIITIMCLRFHSSCRVVNFIFNFYVFCSSFFFYSIRFSLSLEFFIIIIFFWFILAFLSIHTIFYFAKYDVQPLK